MKRDLSLTLFCLAFLDRDIYIYRGCSILLGYKLLVVQKPYFEIVNNWQLSRNHCCCVNKHHTKKIHTEYLRRTVLCIHKSFFGFHSQQLHCHLLPNQYIDPVQNFHSMVNMLHILKKKIQFQYVCFKFEKKIFYAIDNIILKS